MERITVAIAADVGAGMTQCRRMLRLDTRISVLPRATGGEDLVAWMLRLRPRILLMGVHLCTDEDYLVLEELRRACPETRVMLVGHRPIEEDRLARAIVVGAHGYLEQRDLEHFLPTAVHGMDQGEAWVPRKVLGKIMNMALS